MPHSYFTDPAYPAYPADPLAAVSHAAPYAYYRHLAAGPPLRFDTTLDCWLATGAAGVQAVLAHADCHVRRLGHTVPPHLAGTPCGTIFAELVRMNEGVCHGVPKQVLATALGRLDLARLQQRTREIALEHLPASPARLNEALYTLPLFAMADVLGFAPAQWPALAAWTRDFVACLSPLSTVSQLAGAQLAAAALLQRFATLLQEGAARPGSLLASIVSEAQAQGWHASGALLANLVGLLSQTCDATAGLLGNAIAALRTQPGLSAQLRAAPRLWPTMLRETSRYDPAIHNTRRHAACAVEFDGVTVQAGQMILVVLASACHDASVQANPGRFQLQRPMLALDGFGHGRHACPGVAVAQTIAAAGMQAWADVLQAMPLAWTYQASHNARIPVFFQKETA